MGALVRVNAAIEKGRVRSERGLGCKQGSKRYLTGL